MTGTAEQPVTPDLTVDLEKLTRGLDRVDSLPVGTGQLDVGAILRGDWTGGLSGIGVDYSHRITERSSVYAQAIAALGWGHLAGLHYEAGVGYRFRL